VRRLVVVPFFRNNRAVSVTVSAIIITVTTVALVLVASIYAYQVLDYQRGSSEFEVVRRAILAFDDALENIAWKPGASRSTRFTIEYGHLQLVPSVNKISITATVNGQLRNLSTTTFPGSTGMIKYWLSTKYVSFTPSYESYILGDNSSVTSGSTNSYGRAVIKQQTGWVTIALDYRVRALRSSVIEVNGVNVNYVDINVIKVSMLVSSPWSYVHDFDLKASCVSAKTVSYESSVNGDQIGKVFVQIGNDGSEVPLDLVSGKVVFNVVVSEVQVSV